ncbi:hypothetical protein [Streptomyces sp. NPDC020965]|uniref:hypothetical protein n=1 Tax=Streptomyces sp. NPDC020965 TaxID=3365105 RepID=UPI0037A9B8FB
MTAVSPIQIHVLSDEQDDDVALADVGVVNVNGARHLFLRPQSFYSAVRQIKAAMPDLLEEEIERLVRQHAEFKDFDELLGPFEPAPPVDLPPTVEEPLAPADSVSRVKKWAVAVALVPAFVGTWALGHVMGADASQTAASVPDENPGTNSSTLVGGNLGPKPFEAPHFMDFSETGKIDCTPMGTLAAECTDSDGTVMATKAANGPDYTVFTFSYGSERLGLRIFGDADYAKTWAQQDGSKELYPNMSRTDRYVLWGTDQTRLNEYLELLRAEPRKMPASHASGPLPARLAALTLGTLGLDVSDMPALLSPSQKTRVDASVLKAAHAVLGVDNGSYLGVVPDGAKGAPALALGDELSPVPVEPSPIEVGSGQAIAPAPWPSAEASPGGGSPAPEPAAPLPPPPPTPDPTSPPPPLPDPSPVPDPPPDPPPDPKEKPCGEEWAQIVKPKPKPKPRPPESGKPSTAPVLPVPVPPHSLTPKPKPGSAGAPLEDREDVSEDLPVTGELTARREGDDLGGGGRMVLLESRITLTV